LGHFARFRQLQMLTANTYIGVVGFGRLWR
jgi:hypothetical protein